MSDTSSSGLGDLLGLFGASNVLSGISRSVGQFQKGIADFLQAVENFNGTMAQLNAIAARVSLLLDDVEPPIRALMPQVTRTVVLMDTWTQQLSAPIERVAPGLSKLADTLSSPVLSALPADLGAFVEVIGDLARRLQPLGQMAETAGSLFGFRTPSSFFSLGSRGSEPPATSDVSPAASSTPPAAAPKRTAKAPAATAAKTTGKTTGKATGKATAKAAPKRPSTPGATTAPRARRPG